MPKTFEELLKFYSKLNKRSKFGYILTNNNSKSYLYCDFISKIQCVFRLSQKALNTRKSKFAMDTLGKNLE